MLQGSYEAYILTEEYKAKIKVQEDQLKKESLQSQIDELDIKRIRAIAEGGNYNSGVTWLDYYTSEIQKLRQEFISLG